MVIASFAAWTVETFVAKVCVCVCATPPRHVCVWGANAIWFDNGYALPLNSTQARNRYLSPSYSLPFPLAVCDVISVFFCSVHPRGGHHKNPLRSCIFVYINILLLCAATKKSTKLLKNVAPKKRKFAIKEIYINIMHACIFIRYINSLILLQNKSYKMQ